MEIVITPLITEAIAELRVNGLFHLNGFLALIDHQDSDKIELRSKTIEVIINVFEKEKELLYDACQFCLSGPDQYRIREMQECTELLQILIDHLTETIALESE